MAVDFIQKSAGNSASTTLSSSVSNVDTSFPLTSDTAFLSGGGLVIIDEGQATEELAYYTGKVGSSLTIPLANRGLEGGSAQAHASGATVKGILSADMWNNLTEAMINLVSVSTGAVDPSKVVPASYLDTDGTLAANSDTKVSTQKAVKTYSLPLSYLDTDGTLAANSDTKVASQKAVKTYVQSSISSADGWTSSSDTWTYVSSTSFKISGSDKTTTFTKGTRIKLTQTTDKFFVVTSSTFSTDTTVNITGGTDYTLANAAITSPYYSYQLSPQGYPNLFNWSPTIVGFSSNPTNSIYLFGVNGDTCQLYIRQATAGTSNATNFTISLPITAQTLSNQVWIALCQTKDAGVTQAGDCYVVSAGTVLNVEKSVGSANFTNSGDKSLPSLDFRYQI